MRVLFHKAWAYLPHMVITALVLLAAVLVYQHYATNSALERAKKPGAMAILGNPDAAMTIVEYVDYNCPPCAKASSALAQVLTKRRDVRAIVRPLPMLGKQSRQVAKLAIAAAAQNKFQAYHSALMAKIAELGRGKGKKGNKLNKDTALNVARATGLDLKALRSAAESQQVQKIVEHNVTTANKLEIRHVPTFIIGRRLYTPFNETPQPEDFHRMLDAVQRPS